MPATVLRIASTSSVTISLPASAWPAAVEPLGKQAAGRVGLLGARVGDGQHRDPQRMEGQALVYSGHVPLHRSRAL